MAELQLDHTRGTPEAPRDVICRTSQPQRLRIESPASKISAHHRGISRMFRSPLSCFVLVACGLAGPAGALPIPQPPAVTARAYSLIDYRSGRVLAADHADDRMEPA